MDEHRKKTLDAAERKVMAAFGQEEGAHDHYHIFRVRDNALWIMEQERSGDPYFVRLGALLHDVGDPKFFDGDIEKGETRLKEWLDELEILPEDRARILKIVRNISFKGSNVKDEAPDVETKIVQDADRLDAMGAIGIARAFAFGGNRGRPIHIPGTEAEAHSSYDRYLASKSPTVQHFHEKLFHLKDRMKTETARGIAVERHRFMEAYLERFHQEWEGKA